MKKTLSRNEVFGKALYDNVTFTPKYLKLEDYNAEEVFFEKNNTPNLRVDILSAPIRVYLDLTTECSLRCDHCLNSSGKKSLDELSEDEWLSVVSGLADDGVLDIKLTGGEFTLKEGWQNIARHIKNNNMLLTMNTNGNYGSQIIDNLIQLNPDEVSVSIDGIATHYNIRHNMKAFDTVKVLHSAGVRTVINTVITKQLNASEAKELIEFSNLYADDISFFPARPLGNAKASMIPSYDDLVAFGKELNYVKSHNEHLNKASFKESVLGLRIGSGDGLTRFNIMANGDLFAGGCALYVNGMRQELLLGNIKDEHYSILNIWHNSKKLDEFRDWTRNLQLRCNKCAENDCSGLIMEMEVYRKATGFNPYCKSNAGEKI
jgi:MoaA/NifB/PqqE/SkfB family radical SAM enzyme